jgi:hypothetical protein
MEILPELPDKSPEPLPDVSSDVFPEVSPFTFVGISFVQDTAVSIAAMNA